MFLLTLTIVVLVLIVVLTRVLKARSKPSRAEVLAALGKAFDGGMATIRSEGSFVQAEGRFQGRDVSLSFGALRSTPDVAGRTFLLFRLACSSPLSFALFKMDSVFPNHTHIRFGDAHLDREFALESRDADRPREWLLKPDNKETVIARLRQGGTGAGLELKEGILTWSIDGAKRARESQRKRTPARPGAWHEGARLGLRYGSRSSGRSGSGGSLARNDRVVGSVPGAAALFFGRLGRRLLLPRESFHFVETAGPSRRWLPSRGAPFVCLRRGLFCFTGGDTHKLRYRAVLVNSTTPFRSGL